MAADEREGAACADAPADELAAHVARLFRHAGEHPAAQMLRELILRHRREQGGCGADDAEHGDD